MRTVMSAQDKRLPVLVQDTPDVELVSGLVRGIEPLNEVSEILEASIVGVEHRVVLTVRPLRDFIQLEQ